MASAPPEDFRCPISLELMGDPVILATGQTYDRASIQRWLDAGHRTCPKTKQVLYDTKLIPNYALRSLIYQWANANGVDLKRPTESFVSADTGKYEVAEREGLLHMKVLVEDLIKSLSSTTVQTRRDAIKKISELAKESKERRNLIVEAGGIACILPLTSCGDPHIEDAGLQSLLELSLDDDNKVGLVAEGAVDAIVQALRMGSMDIRIKAARTLTSLALVDVNKATIGSQHDVIPALVKLLAEGNIRGKKESMSALCALCMFHDNKPRAVLSGVVPLLLALLIEGRSELVELALTVLDFLSTSIEGRIAITREPALPTLVGLLKFGTSRSKEHAAAVLWSLCFSSKKYTLQAFNAGALDTCSLLMQVGTARAKRKAGSLVKAFQECGRW
ncbi:hypothetical protein KP509_27G047700 [Ceratopteris richardii]|uniref:RING-type E3 ubiquitin transferase n=1 Tax=Ceratopteris richardii TaxID=49495 RepID=A0A8T2RIP1_CERRI|nr:hypothetical protein KP509_27G047700 [Ceratopteris richardii]